MRKVICIDADFTDFMKIMGSGYNFPKEGEVYEVRGDNGRGGIILKGLTNPYTLLSFTPLLFEEVHFNKQRFLEIEDTRNEDTPLATFHVCPN